MAELHALLEEQLKRHHLSAVKETLIRISRQPGFSGVREQSWALFQFARKLASEMSRVVLVIKSDGADSDMWQLRLGESV